MMTTVRAEEQCAAAEECRTEDAAVRIETEIGMKAAWTGIEI